MFHVRYYKILLKRFLLNYKGFAVLSLLLIFIIAVKIMNLGSQIVEVNVLSNWKFKTTTHTSPMYLNPERLKDIMINKKKNQLMSEKNKTEMKMKYWKEKIESLNKMRSKSSVRRVEVNETIDVNYNVHVFYYAWYENEKYDGKWEHWNHKYLNDWRKLDSKVYFTGRHEPPDDIGSNFYPKLGCYSSRDPAVLEKHMKQIRDAGIGVLIVSWYPPGMSDGSSRSPDTIFLTLLNVAHKYQLKVSPHIEPYNNRTSENFLQHLKYFTNTYDSHPALYKIKKEGKNLTVYYIYDSYRTPASQWKDLFDPLGSTSVRGSHFDGIFLGLLVDSSHRNEIKKARFDGFYTYFASNGFSYGSTWKYWNSLAIFARSQGLIFIPSVGPGYVDTRVRPWNYRSTRHRRNGKYYDVGWRTAIKAGVDRISITSFNEWHEGTQIEPAVPKATNDFVYLDYEPEGPDFYLNLTKFWISRFNNKSLLNAPIL